MKQKTNETNSSRITRGRLTAGVTAAAALLVLSAQAQPTPGFVTSVQPYAKSISGDYVVVPLLSAGDRVALTSDPTKQYQMIGVPDGLGAYKSGRGSSVLYMNHEVAATAISEPVIGESLHRGAFVSKFLLNAAGEVTSGERAYDVIIDPLGNSLPPARTDNASPAFNRFCSGTLAWLDAGFDRPIYLCGEENPAPATFDGKGGL